VAVEHRITAFGKRLHKPTYALLPWAAVHLPQVVAARARFDE